LSIGITDDDESVDSDDGHGHGGDVDRGSLRHRKESAEDLSEMPFAGERLDRSEGHGEAAHQDVGAGQVRDEQVGRVDHVPVLEDHEGHQQVSADAEEEDDEVEGGEDDLEEDVLDELLFRENSNFKKIFFLKKIFFIKFFIAFK
jgi:hypothetical protein